MKLLESKYLHNLYLILSFVILLLYLINPTFLGYDLNLLFNIVLVILLLLQLGEIIYSNTKSCKNKNLIMISEILDVSVPIITLFIGVDRLNF